MSLVQAQLREDDTLLELILSGPKGNILTRAMMEELAAHLSAHAADVHLRSVLIRSAGKNFSFGASVEEHRRDAAPAMLRTFHTLIRQVASYPVPVAALVAGRCLGGAFELTLACHLVHCTPSAVFACPEIKLGVFPPVLAVLGRERLGASLCERLLLTGGELDALLAQGCGWATLVDEAEPEAGLLSWYRTHLKPHSAYSLRQAVRAARQVSGALACLAEPLDAAERLYLEALLPSHDGNEGIEAFLAKRAPQWSDD